MCINRGNVSRRPQRKHNSLVTRLAIQPVPFQHSLQQPLVCGQAVPELKVPCLQCQYFGVEVCLRRLQSVHHHIHPLSLGSGHPSDVHLVAFAIEQRGRSRLHSEADEGPLFPGVRGAQAKPRQTNKSLRRRILRAHLTLARERIVHNTRAFPRAFPRSFQRRRVVRRTPSRSMVVGRRRANRNIASPISTVACDIPGVCRQGCSVTDKGQAGLCSYPLRQEWREGGRRWEVLYLFAPTSPPLPTLLGTYCRHPCCQQRCCSPQCLLSNRCKNVSSLMLCIWLGAFWLGGRLGSCSAGCGV